MWPFFYFLAILLSGPGLFAQQTSSSYEVVLSEAIKHELYNNKQWQRLMHYQPTLFGGIESQVDGEEYFLAPNGKINSKAELEATIKGFFSSVEKNKLGPVACRFPARYLWLQKELKELNISWPEYDCPRFYNFRDRLAAQSVSLVFSSYYLNNPSSAFGHTLLRINKAPSARDGKRYELLDYGIGYAATVDTGNALIYAIKGLSGMFKGEFTSVPYYYKVREYNDFESRDLWEYDLNIDPKSMDILVAHIWELGQANIDYYYFSENCAYHVFSIIEAADPNVDVTSKFKFYVIPSDTVLAAWQTPGLITNVQYRPSIRSVFFERIKKLNDRERERVEQFSRDGNIANLTSGLEQQEKVHVLDAAMDFVDFSYADKILKEDQQAIKYKRELLSLRSEIPVASEPFKVVPDEDIAPHKAHGSGRVGLGLANVEDESVINFRYRGALHDLLDPKVGYPDYAQINFFQTEFSYNTKTQDFYLEDWSMFEVISNSVYSPYTKNRAWRIKLGVERSRDANCRNCHQAVLKGGYGLAFEPIKNLTLTPSVRVGGMYSSDFQPEDFKVGAGPAFMLRYRISDEAAFLIDSWYRYDYRSIQTDYHEIYAGLQVGLSKDLALRAYGRSFPGVEESGLDLMFYY